MNGDYVKVVREIQQSSSWNRGLLYQGLFFNILLRTVWQETPYCGRVLRPGQAAVVLHKLSEELGIPHATLRRMINHWVTDGYLCVENVVNRFYIITVKNLGGYDEQTEEGWLTGFSTMVNHTSQSCQTIPYNNDINNIKKKTIPPPKGGMAKVLPAETVETDARPPGRSRKAAGAYSADFEAFWQRYPRKTGKDAAWKVWQRRKGEIPRPDELAGILTRQRQSEQWLKDNGQFIPHPATWLRQGRWKDEDSSAVDAPPTRAVPAGSYGPLRSSPVPEELTPEEQERARAARKRLELEWRQKQEAALRPRILSALPGSAAIQP